LERTKDKLEERVNNLTKAFNTTKSAGHNKYTINTSSIKHNQHLKVEMDTMKSKSKALIHDKLALEKSIIEVYI
jgi:hypothetical protein